MANRPLLAIMPPPSSETSDSVTAPHLVPVTSTAPFQSSFSSTATLQAPELGTLPVQAQIPSADPLHVLLAALATSLAPIQGTAPSVAPTQGTAPSVAPTQGTAPSLARTQCTAPSLAPMQGTAPSLAPTQGTAPFLSQTQGTVPSQAPMPGTRPFHIQNPLNGGNANNIASIMLNMHYLFGGRWWDIDVDELFKTADEDKPSASEAPKDNGTRAETEDIAESDDGSTSRVGTQRGYRKKKKSKSKKKSKRGHAKRNRGKENREQDFQDENNDPLNSIDTNNADRNNSSAGYSALQTRTKNVTDVESRNGSVSHNETENATRLNENQHCHYWQQFSGAPSASGPEKDFNQSCTKCGSKGINLMTCKRCGLAKYCCKMCEKKDAKRHKTTCLRIFGFHSANKSAQPFLKFYQSVRSSRVEKPPVSYYMGSLPDTTRYEQLRFHPPVLLEIFGAGLATDFKDWVLDVRDVANNTTKVLIETKEKQIPLKRAENIELAKTLRPGNFLLILDAPWLIGASKESCVIELGERSQYHVIDGVDWSKLKGWKG